MGDIIAEMERKVTDAKRIAEKLRWNKDKWRKSFENRGEFSKGQVKKVISRLKRESDTLREDN